MAWRRGLIIKRVGAKPNWGRESCSAHFLRGTFLVDIERIDNSPCTNTHVRDIDK